MYIITLDDKPIHNMTSKKTQVIEPVLEMKLGTAGSLSFKIPQKNPYYENLERMKPKLKVYCDKELLWKGRILDEDNDWYNTGSITAEGELSYLLDSIQRPYDGDLDFMAYLEFLLNRHNEQVDEDKKIYLGEVTITPEEADTARISTDYKKTKDILDSIVTDHEGYLQIRTAEGKLYLDYLKEYAGIAAQKINFGQNLLNITRTQNGADIKTVIIPLGATIGNERLTIESVNDGKDYLVDQEAAEKYGMIVGAVVFDKIEDEAELLEEGKSYLRDVNKPKLTIEATAVDLSLVNKDVNSFRPGDQVGVISPPHNIDGYFQVNSVRLDLANPEKSEVVLGETIPSLTGKTASGRVTNQDVLNQIQAGIVDAKKMADTAKKAADSIAGDFADHKVIVEEEMTSISEEFKIIRSDIGDFNVVVTNKISALDGYIGTLEGEFAKFKVGEFEDLKTKALTAETADIRYASIDNLTAAEAEITKVSGELAEYKTVVATDIDAVNAQISSLNTEYAQIDLANIKDGCITTAMIGTGVVDTAQIADGSITDAKIVALTANKITAGKLDAAEIEVINLNCANLTVGTINGQQIASGAVDLSKLSTELSGTITGTAKDVQNALADAGLAINKANDATTAASTAQDTANTAKTNAATAQAAADKAKADAAAAKSTADKAQIDLTKAEANLNAVTNRVGATEEEITAAQAAVTVAQTAANNAKKAADSAESAASTAQSTANTAKNNAATAQTAAENAQKTANAAAAAASSAQTTANGKNTVFYQTSAPATTGRKVNDIWFDTDDGNKMYCWSGTAWTAKQFSTNAIAANAITANLITAGAITAVKLAINAVTADKIYAGAVTVDKIAAGAVDTDKLKANAVTAAKIAVGTITAGCLAANSITADKISSNAVIAAKIAANAITSDKIVADAITTAKIAAGAVTATEIATNAITAAKIKAGTITADKIDINDLFSKNITATGTIVGGIMQSAGFEISDLIYDESGNIVSGTVKDGSRIDLINGSIETPQITIKKDYINIKGMLTVGYNNWCSSIGSILSGVNNSALKSRFVSMLSSNDCDVYDCEYFSTISSNLCGVESENSQYSSFICSDRCNIYSDDKAFRTTTSYAVVMSSTGCSIYGAENSSILAGLGNGIDNTSNSCIAGGAYNQIDSGSHRAFIGGGSWLRAENENVAVFGQYNDPAKDRSPLLIVGNGEKNVLDGTKRHNAFEVDEDGSVFIDDVNMTLDQATIDLWTKILGGG